MGRRGIILTAADVERHQRRHGFLPGGTSGASITPASAKITKPRMNGTESSFALILEARKRKGEIVEWRYEGIKLAWGADPRTGKSMIYTPDFFVVVDGTIGNPDLEAGIGISDITLIEVKGAHIFDRDLVRFKGCRAAWPLFRFEMHQKTKEGWRRIH